MVCSGLRYCAGAEQQAGGGQPGAVDQAGDAEVGQLGAPRGAVVRGADHHVRRLDVTVDDPRVVDRLQ